MSSCCESPKKPATEPGTSHGGCAPRRSRPDYLLWGSLVVVVLAYGHYWLWESSTHFLAGYHAFVHGVFELINTMWWGVALGIVMLALLAKIPREFVMSVLGTSQGLSGIIRATAAGVLLDLCSHGILMVGAKLYERGASAGQVMAFLLASPWNSFSLTLVLVALIGLPWTLAFIVFSGLVAICTGLVFNFLVARNVLPANPHSHALPEDFKFWSSAKAQLKAVQWRPSLFSALLLLGIKESRMVMRWLLFGVVLAALVRGLMPEGGFDTYFGPTLLGLGLTVLAATIIEVCSEGSAPIAADLLTKASAPGNSFAFLMAGVATDYTEVMVIKDATRSWKMALFLPLISVPQVLLVAVLMNQISF